jgi:hypothetical protein
MRRGSGLLEPQDQDQPFSRRAIVAVIVRVGPGDVNGPGISLVVCASRFRYGHGPCPRSPLPATVER